MYFLLYVDKELSAEERIAVEEFVLTNMDLKPELDLLLETTMSPDEIVFDEKAGLCKYEITENRLEESMLLYLDNELDASLVEQMDATIIADDKLKREWNILLHTKLDNTEKIIFDNKKSLYRHKKTRVVSMRFWRVAVAAALIVGGIFTGFSIFTKKSGKLDVAVAGKENLLRKKIGSPLKTIISTEGKTNGDQQPAGKAIANVKNANNIAGKYNPARDAGQKDITIQKGDAKKELLATTKRTQPGLSLENINIPKSNETVSSTVRDDIKPLTNKNELARVEQKDLGLGSLVTSKTGLEDKEITLSTNSYAKNAVVDQTATETSENHILFINEEKINRSKMSGLFRKVKRVISRNANVKTGNSIQIAGFEIAAR